MQISLSAPFVSSATGSISLDSGQAFRTLGRCGDEMTPFVEVRCDTKRAEIIRQKLMTMSALELRHHFSGRIPSEAERLAFIEGSSRYVVPLRAFVNNLYRVEFLSTPISGESFLHLSIARLDGGTRKEWRHLQQIKNELVGPEYEAMELFPSEYRLVDCSNEYHLWVHRDPTFRFPVGWVAAHDALAATAGDFRRL